MGEKHLRVIKRRWDSCVEGSIEFVDGESSFQALKTTKFALPHSTL